MPSVSFLGCGRAGQVLGHLWHRSGSLTIGQVLTRSGATAREAVDRIGAGSAPESFAGLEAVEIFLIASPDQVIGDLAARLAGSGLAGPDTITFHLGGALTSSILRDAGLKGPVASIHPLRSFGDFDQSVADFAGTFCACEGDPSALAVLRPAFSSVGGQLFDIATENKLLYHAASVMVSNYMNALAAAGMDTYLLAGIDRDTASKLISPIMKNTLQNILNLGPAESLTGPIARGDWQLVARELESLNKLDEGLAEIYRILGHRTLALAEESGQLGAGDGARLGELLRR